MTVTNQARSLVRSAIEALQSDGALPPEMSTDGVDVDAPRDPSHGDLATNAAMVLTKRAGKKPREIADFKPAQRLTSTFRFDTASFALDTKALADVSRLRALLETPEYRGKTVMIAGFADGVGRFDTNLLLSQKRAATVLAALQRAPGNPIQAQLVTKGFSQLAPVTCNDTLESRTFNRRVEVWVK